jgi:DNA polymerase III epsilon subunit-like protein
MIALTDTETTGLSQSDQVCELATVLLEVREVLVPSENDYSTSHTSRREVTVVDMFTSLVRPSCSMSVGAQATHHIPPEDLLAADSMTDMLMRRGLPEYGHYPIARLVTDEKPEDDTIDIRKMLVSPYDVVFCAHNAEFDRRLLIQSGVHETLLPSRTICTYKCARHLYKDSERYSNQHLFVHLGLDPLFAVIGPPHRALPDLTFTGAILVHMLREHSVDELVALTEKPVLLEKWSFGKHRGTRFRDLDTGMLQWIVGKDFGDDEKYTARYWLDVKTGKREHRD